MPQNNFPKLPQFPIRTVVKQYNKQQKMQVLYVNCHKKTEEGRLRFENFHKSVRGLLESTVYYGRDPIETVRGFDQLDDYIYDQMSFRTEPRTLGKFESLEYLIVDGGCNFAPWTDCMADAMLLLRKSIEDGKRVLCNGFGHFAANYLLSTGFDKQHKIAKMGQNIQCDYQWEEETGDLRLKGQKITNSGVRVAGGSRPFSDKSSQAVHKGLTLTSKFQHVVFQSKSGSRLTRNIECPFGFYWKSKLFCTSKLVSHTKADILFQTQKASPLAFTYKQMLSVQGLCPHFLKLIKNWLVDHSQRSFLEQSMQGGQSYQTIAFENKLEYRKILSSSASQLRPSKSINRPQSSKFSTITFERPIVRCSGRYETTEERFLKEEIEKKIMNVGRSRLVFKGGLQENQIATYVQREPSRPASSHKFREVKKDRWVGGRDFINC